MTVEYPHRFIPPIDQEAIFDADLDYLVIESIEDPSHRQRLLDLKNTQPDLYRRLLRHAAVEAAGDATAQDKLLSFGMYVLEIIGRGIEHEKTVEDESK